MNHQYLEKIKMLTGTTGPMGRSDHAAILHDDKLYIHGGERTNCNKFCDFWEFDFCKQIWLEIESESDGPSKRSGHKMVVHNDQFYVFGGFNYSNEECSDFWKFSLGKASNLWRRTYWKTLSYT
jgi:N-acetylneuraminic acid mutarotase